MNLKSSNQPVNTPGTNKKPAKGKNLGLKVKMIISVTIIVLLIACNSGIYYIVGLRYGPDWNIETVDSNERAWDAGCSIGLTPEGTPVIEYKSQFGILLAQGNGNHDWQHENVVNAVYLDEGSSMVVDNAGIVHLLYVGVHKKLVYAIKDKGTWQRQTSEDINYGRSVLAIDRNNNPHIVYSRSNHLNYTYRDNGIWTNNTIENETMDVPIEMVLDSSDFPHVLTRGDFYNEFKYYSWNGSNWSKEKIDAQAYMKYYLSDLGIDSNDSPHIVFVDEENASLKYMTKTGNEWNIQNVDTDGISHRPAITIDKNDVIHIAYYSDNNGLKYAKKVQNTWSLEIIDSSRKAGSHPSIIADDAGNIHIAYIDRNVWHLNYATTKRSGFFRMIPIGISEYAIFILASALIVIIAFISVSRWLARRKKKIETRNGHSGKDPVPLQR